MPCQQDTLYTAELQVGHGFEFESLEHVQKWVDDLRDSWWWIKWLDGLIFRVEIGRAAKGALHSVGWFDEDAMSGRIEFNTTTPTILYALHELAHVLAGARWRSNAHDPWMARIFLQLVYFVMGSESYLELYTAFTLNGVDFDSDGLI